MSEEFPARLGPVDRRRLLALMLAAGVSLPAAAQRATADGEALRNPLLWALAWQQTAAEFEALCYQAYCLARLRVDQALAAHGSGDRPLAIITDIDNTVLHANSYWAYLASEDRDFFDDAIWDDWVPENLMTPVPGALDFLRDCTDKGVAVFYVTSRDQGERTFDYALGQLQALAFPQADAEHLYVFRDTSDKTPARQEIAARYDVAVLLGDNLNDFRRDYYVADVAERKALMRRDRDEWGAKFILLPNPTDGHWVRAIFGESEPAATDANRRRLKSAATRGAWDGRS